MQMTKRVLGAGLAVSLAFAGACSSDDAADDAPDTTAAPDTSGASDTADAETTTTTEAPPESLRILVSNDDGIGAEGIDAVVRALTALPNTEVYVYAPAEQQSGTGGSVTAGELNAGPAKTVSGVDGVAVAGFPADSVNYALDVMEIVTPHLVVTGLNEGANLGAFVEVSGTVGAARAGVRHGIPALATSMSGTDTFNYDLGATYIVEWVEEHREALLGGTASVEVVNLNVPTCTTGAIRGEVTIEVDYQNSDYALMSPDCTSTEEAGASDIVAFSRGFVTWSVVTNDPTPNVFSNATTTIPAG